MGESFDGNLANLRAHPSSRYTNTTQSSTPWSATLNLSFSEQQGRTVLKHSHNGPLRIQRPLYPEDNRCQVHILHPPAGIVSGDRLAINAEINTGADVQLLTPGATLLYRGTGQVARVETTCRIDDRGCLEYLPQETIHYTGAVSRGHSRIHLSRSARLIWRDTHCLGRPGADEKFTSGDMRWRIEITRDGAPLWIENTVVGAPNWVTGIAGMRGYAYSGTLVATPVSTEECQALREHMPVDTVLTVVEGLLIARYLGDDGKAWRTTSERLWQLLRPSVIGAAPTNPRIWAT